MQYQLSFSDLEYATKKKVTGRDLSFQVKRHLPFNMKAGAARSHEPLRLQISSLPSQT